MQTLLHIIETEILIALGVYLFAHVAVWFAMRVLMGGRRSESSETNQR